MRHGRFAFKKPVDGLLQYRVLERCPLCTFFRLHLSAVYAS